MYTKAPKIQRLVTPQRLQHKRHRIALKRRRAEASKDAAVSSIYINTRTMLLTYYTERVCSAPPQAHHRGQVCSRRGEEEAGFVDEALDGYAFISSGIIFWRRLENRCMSVVPGFQAWVSHTEDCSAQQLYHE